ncbi:MAG: YraN family protein [Alphaproteobacteria bacterium]|nr:YraN family protein [Alphaproteobacteria bacterium]
MNKKEIKGYFGEFLAMALLILKGYRIVAHRYKTRLGEIDIVAKKGNTIAFVEVKSRNDQEKCFVAITAKQLRRIQNASVIFLEHHNFTKCNLSYDVVLVANWKFPLHITNVTM